MRRLRHIIVRAGIGLATTAAGLLLATGSALADGPGLPGPPPGAGSGLPLPPPPGQGPAPRASQPATAIPTPATGPGLISGFATVSANAVRLQIACRVSGAATLRSGTATVKTSYRCTHGQANLRFTPTRGQAGQLTAGGTAIGSLALTGGGSTRRLSVSLSTGVAVPDYWTSTFGMSCTAGGPNSALLTAPNFSVTPATTVDVRPWLAWYTPRTGWQWLGTRGPGKSAWYRWTATPTGVAEWQLGGTISPWTWGPITVTPGHGTRLVAVFEAVYWYGHPAYVWRYVRSQPGSNTSDCVYR
jgi:hypothetical protein